MGNSSEWQDIPEEVVGTWDTWNGDSGESRQQGKRGKEREREKYKIKPLTSRALCLIWEIKFIQAKSLEIGEDGFCHVIYPARDFCVKDSMVSLSVCQMLINGMTGLVSPTIKAGAQMHPHHSHQT